MNIQNISQLVFRILDEKPNASVSSLNAEAATLHFKDGDYKTKTAVLTFAYCLKLRSHLN